MKTLIAIIVDDAGTIQIQSQVPDAAMALGLLEIAKDAIKDMARQAQQKPAIVLPPVGINGRAL